MTAPVSPRDLLHTILAAPDIVEGGSNMMFRNTKFDAKVAVIQNGGAKQEVELAMALDPNYETNIHGR